MSDDEKEDVLCEACRALNQHETAHCPYALHRVHARVAKVRQFNNVFPREDAIWVRDEMDRWAARWVAARDATIAAQYRAAEAIEIRFVNDDDGCTSCAHYLERIGTCMGPKLQQARQLDAGVYVPPWCPGFKAKADEAQSPTKGFTRLAHPLPVSRPARHGFTAIGEKPNPDAPVGAIFKLDSDDD